MLIAKHADGLLPHRQRVGMTLLPACSIYEAIGRGKHSVVYKGRKKKTIQYYAIKSVDKSQKARVLQEVRAHLGACKQWLKASKAAWPLNIAPRAGGTHAAGGQAC